MKRNRVGWLGVVMSCFMPVAAFCQTAVPSTSSSPDERLVHMQSTGATYSVELDSKRRVTFRRDPVLRFTNPVSGVVDGGLFVWQVDGGRPVAVAQLFIAPGTDDLWIHEFQSLTPGSDVASLGAVSASLGMMTFAYEDHVVWSPKSAGLEFKTVAGVSPPAKSAGARLTQMRQIVRRFSVTDDFEGADGDELRLMTTPLVRYADLGQ